MSPNNGKTDNNRANKADFSVRIVRRAKLLYLRILRLDDPPERIAAGAAIGILMGVLPTFGIGGALALGLAFVFKANKAAAVIASAVVNPLTSPFFWTASIVIGSAITGNDSAAILAKFKGEEIFTAAAEVSLVYMAGNALMSVIFTAGTYFLTKKIIVRHRERKTAKRRDDA
ncbi:MAG: hypothetical protein A3J24_04325 [Deltaproteobacteria bacterium RIFCSPLOWO2_02_FULL_53_8]|nr:MAG: hypothetical protein A3J24_04325 [Deltaproteobacteria bacterium RIFCSPLOWO2_02_FULL_53_8]